MKIKHTLRAKGAAILLVMVLLCALIPFSALATGNTEAVQKADQTAKESNNSEQTISQAYSQQESPTVDVDVHIRTAADLLALSTNCQMENYSIGLVVSLEQDINLDGISFSSIPTFSGTFLGNEHTISGFSCASNGSHQGFFRYVRAEGAVINLKLTGSVDPSDGRCAVGGLVGTNYGFVGNCQFDGTVSGLLNIGGIAGENYGIVKDCISAGSVSGKHFVGGVVGYNEGSIAYCRSDAEVNTEVLNEALSLDSLDVSDILGLKTVSETKIDKVSDIGGIAGISTGIIKACENTGVSDWVVDKGTAAGDKVGEYGDIIGEDTIGNVVNGEITETDKENLGNAAIHGANNIADSINKQKEENSAEDAADQEMMNNVNNAIQSSKALGNSLNSTIDQLTKDLAGVSEHYNRILGMIANALSGNYELTILNDISDQDTEQMKDGKVENCTNSGTVSTDSGVGGIIATMDTELDFDVEKILSSTVSDTVELSSASYYCRNILTDCINDGIVEGKKDNVGGVVGLNAIGNVLMSQNYGDVTGNGEYYGGVAGKSTGAVRKCFAMCALEGTSYVGGVTGQGKVVENCSTIVTTDQGTACSGSIAGCVDFSKSDVNVTNNYFVNDAMGGIDGISYEGVCERVSYKELLTMNALPDKFRTLKLTFMADGKVVDTISFTYGDSLQESDIPAVPEKDGISGVWEPFTYENMTRSQTIEAQYNARQSVVSSDKVREGSPMSLVLVQGAFAQNTSLIMADYTGNTSLPIGAEKATVLKIQGTNPTLNNYTVRWNTDGVSAKVYRLNDDGVWEHVKSKMDGHFCLFTCSGKEVVLCVIDSPQFFLTRNILLALAVLALAALLVWYLDRKHHFLCRCKEPLSRILQPIKKFKWQKLGSRWSLGRRKARAEGASVE